ncbi:hypothetical protein [Polynucleobacter corsicus]|uniref:hypothetical protein n=1 Tax=Polynucleobacter corsicus TaxID=2081042 RepID=UPI001BFDA69E|nr:hypothetical protein [Polynucleobacter corsicus]QWE19204.1 hypothetical protein C2747_02945 [Polynucleobacter corsicus]
MIDPVKLEIKTLPEFKRFPAIFALESMPKLLAPDPVLIIVPALFKLLVSALINNGPSHVEAVAVEVLDVQLAAFTQELTAPNNKASTTRNNFLNEVFIMP